MSYSESIKALMPSGKFLIEVMMGYRCTGPQPAYEPPPRTAEDDFRELCHWMYPQGNGHIAGTGKCSGWTQAGPVSLYR